MIQLTDLEKYTVKEQCQFCRFWQDDKGCQYPGSLTITPQPGCYTKKTAIYFIKDKLPCPKCLSLDIISCPGGSNLVPSEETKDIKYMCMDCLFEFGDYDVNKLPRKYRLLCLSWIKLKLWVKRRLVLIRRSK